MQGQPGAAGAQGDQGPQGPDGLQGLSGPEGPQGQQGIQGAAGLGISFQGQVATVEDLPADAEQGAAYIVQADDSFWVWDGGSSSWVNGGSIQGPQGIAGPQGAQGLKGELGPQGLQGVEGPGRHAGHARYGVVQRGWDTCACDPWLNHWRPLFGQRHW